MSNKLKKFTVEIKEVGIKRVEIDAATAEEAEEKALTDYENGVILLEAEDYDLDFTAEEVTK